jgi:hypothetical protein
MCVDEPHDLCTPPTKRIVKYRSIRWAGLVARMEETNVLRKRLSSSWKGTAFLSFYSLCRRKPIVFWNRRDHPIRNPCLFAIHVHLPILFNAITSSAETSSWKNLIIYVIGLHVSLTRRKWGKDTEGGLPRCSFVVTLSSSPLVLYSTDEKSDTSLSVHKNFTLPPHRMSKPTGWHSCFVFGRSQVQISAWRSDILT